MIEYLRRLLDILAGGQSTSFESPQALEQRKTFEAFLLAEYNNIANAHFNTVDSIANFMKNYIAIASVPFFVVGVLLSAKQSPDNAILSAVTQSPIVPGVLMIGLATVGLFVLGYVINIRCDALLYARVVNGIRHYFYIRMVLPKALESEIRVLPVDIQQPKYFEPMYFGFVVAVFAFIGAAYFWVGLYYIEFSLRAQSHLSLGIGTILFLSCHFFLYRMIADRRERAASGMIEKSP